MKDATAKPYYEMMDRRKMVVCHAIYCKWNDDKHCESEVIVMHQLNYGSAPSCQKFEVKE